VRCAKNDRDAVWDSESGGSMEPCIRRGCTLAPLGEYDRIVRIRRRCGLMSNYFDHSITLVPELSPLESFPLVCSA